MLDRLKMIQAVNLSICLGRGYYLGTVERDKREALNVLKSYMSSEQLAEFNEGEK